MRMNRSLIALLIALSIAMLGCGQGASQAQVEKAVQTILTSAEPIDRYRAGSFEVVDDSGIVRAALEAEAGTVRLVLTDPQGINRIAVSLDSNDDPSITLFDESGTRRVGFEFALGISPSLSLRDSAGTLKAGFQVQGDGGPILFFRSHDAENGFAVAMVGDDQPILSLAQPDGQHRVFLGLDSNGFTPALVFLSASGEPTATYP